VKTILLSSVLLIICSTSFCQDIIQSDTDITKSIRVNDTIDLQFLDWPSPGIGWRLYSEYDTTIISINVISSKLMEGNFQFGGKYIKTVQYIGKKTGEVRLEYFWGRPWLQEKLNYCRIAIIIN
jgi:hypothetical protein